MTVAAIGCSIVAIPCPPHLSAAARDAVDFTKLWTAFLTPVVVLSIVFGRPLLWLAIAASAFVIAGLVLDPQ
jgi:hypothetical protein